MSRPSSTAIEQLSFDLVRKLLHPRLREVGQVARAEKAVAELQHARRQTVLAPRRLHVAQVLEREHEAARSGAREARPRSDRGKRRARAVAGDAAQDREPARERLHVVAAVLERIVARAVAPAARLPTGGPRRVVAGMR